MESLNYLLVGGFGIYELCNNSLACGDNQAQDHQPNMRSTESRSPASPRPNQDGEKIGKFGMVKDSSMPIEQAKAKLGFADKNMGKVYAQWRERIKSRLVAMGISGPKDASSVRWGDLLDFA